MPDAVDPCDRQDVAGHRGDHEDGQLIAIVVICDEFGLMREMIRGVEIVLP